MRAIITRWGRGFFGWADDARWFLLAAAVVVIVAWYFWSHESATRSLAALAGKADVSALVPVVSVVVGAALTYAFTGRREVKKDLRDRVLGTAYEAIREARSLSRAIQLWGFHAPRGGGKIRPAGQPEAPWQTLPPEEAAMHDAEAVAAFEAITSSMDALRDHVLELSLVAPRELTTAFEALADRTFTYLMELDPEGGVLLAADFNDFVADIERGINDLVRRVRREVRGDHR